MHARKLIPLTVAMAVLFLAGAAFAGSIDFGFTGENTSSTWSWGGGSSTLSAGEIVKRAWAGPPAKTL